MRKYMWPNSCLPSATALITAAQAASQGRFTLEGVENHAARTPFIFSNGPKKFLPQIQIILGLFGNGAGVWRQTWHKISSQKTIHLFETYTSMPRSNASGSTSLHMLALVLRRAILRVICSPLSARSVSFVPPSAISLTYLFRQNDTPAVCCDWVFPLPQINERRRKCHLGHLGCIIITLSCTLTRRQLELSVVQSWKEHYIMVTRYRAHMYC